MTAELRSAAFGIKTLLIYVLQKFRPRDAGDAKRIGTLRR